MKKVCRNPLELSSQLRPEEFDNIEHYFIHCLHTCGHPLNEIATALNLSPCGLSKRLNMYPSDNDPRFSLRNMERYVRLTKDFRIKKYLENLETEINETEEESTNRRNNELEEIYIMLKKVFEK